MTADDAEAIKTTVNLYGFALDAQRWDLFDQVFTPDVDADYGETSHWTSLEQFKSDFAAYHDPFDGHQHSMMGHLVNVTGDTGYAMTYATWRLLRRGLPGGSFWEGTGWYDDVLVRNGGRWLIKSRICRIIWWGGNPQVAETVPGVRFSMPLTAIREEARLGRVRYLASLDAV